MNQNISSLTFEEVERQMEAADFATLTLLVLIIEAVVPDEATATFKAGRDLEE